MYVFFAILLAIGCLESVGAIDIVNHVALAGGSGLRNGAERPNTLFLKISSLDRPFFSDFIDTLSDAVYADGCEPTFSGQGATELTLTIFCRALGNKERMSVREKAPLPALNHTRRHLRDNECVVDDYEYLGEYRRPAGSIESTWYGNDENMKQSIRLYFEQLDKAKVGTRVDPRARLNPNDVVHGQFVEHMAPWGLDRIDMHFGTLNNDYTYNTLGENVDIYVVDTGIRLTHQEFQGRANFLINSVGDNISGDCVGHGTHVSSLAAGVTYGAAKGALLWDAKSLGCNGAGDTFTIVTSIMAIIEHAATRTGRRAVVSMSLGGDFSTAINNAVLSLVQANINVVVAAGNEYSDACLYSPSSMGTNSGVLTIGASTITDSRPPWSNYGSCVSISAPGDNIIGAYGSGDTATAVLSGTSMATPFVSGVVALVLNQDLTLTVAQVKTKVIQWQTPGVITGATYGGANLVYSLIIANQTAPLVQPPTLPPGIPPDVLLPSSAPSAPLSPLFALITLLFMMLW
jgi:subtilisin family serine protease